MALVLKDRVKETTTSTGTGTITLAGAVAGYQSFSVIGNANTTYYTIADSVSGAWEVGIGTYTASGTTLARNTVLASSNANALVNFPAGEKEVFVTYPAEKASVTYAFGTKTANYTASINEGVLTSTAGGSFTVTLPASPPVGAVVVVSDTASSWGTNNLTIARNGSTIDGLAENLTCDLNDVIVQLIYSGSTWLVYAQVGAGAQQNSLYISYNNTTSGLTATNVQDAIDELQAEKGSFSDAIVSFHAERNSVGTINNFMAMGNGATAIKGARMPFAGQVIQATLHGSNVTGTITVDLAVNGTPNSSYRLTGAGTASDVNVTGNWLSSPLSFNAGDVLNFYQITVPSGASGYVVTWYVKFT